VPKTTPIQESFALGEISPALYGRVTSPGYAQSVKILENMVADPRGLASRRPGTEFAKSILDKARAAVREFQFSVKDSRAVVFVEGELHVMAAGDSLGENKILNHDFTGGGNGWTADTVGGQSSVSFENDQAILSPGEVSGNYAEISQTFSSIVTGTYFFSISGTFNGDATNGVEVKVGTTGVGSSDVVDTLMYGGQTHYFLASIPASGIELTVTIRALDNSGESTVDSVAYAEELPNTDGVVFDSGSANPPPWQESDLENIQVAQNPTGETMYIVDGRNAPYKLTFVSSVWALEPVAFTNAPTIWGGSGNPGTVTFFQGRSWWAGHALEKTTIWGSKPNDYEDLTMGAGDQPDDAIEFVLAENGQIRWLQGLANLIVGTEFRELILTSQGGVLLANDVDAQPQSANGSNVVQGKRLGNEVLYVSPDGRRVRTVKYKRDENGYLSRDLSFNAEHATRGEVKSSSVGVNPLTRLYFAQHNGVMLVCGYHRDDANEPTYGWSRHDMSYGFIDDVVTVTVSGVAQLWLVVSRGDDIHVEVIKSLSAEEGESPVYLDAYAEEKSNTLTNVITNLDHLEGQTVQAVVDEAYDGEYVVSGGEITTNTSGYVLQAGLQILSKLTTLPYVAGGKDSATSMFEKQWAKIYARVIKSGLPLINGQRAPIRTPPTPMGLAQPFVTGDTEVTTLGWDRFGEIDIEQDLPVPLRLSMLHGELAQENT
jgi:hypothetical protein